MTDYFPEEGAGATGTSGGGFEPNGYLAIRSFAVRAFLERSDRRGLAWRGYITNVTTRRRRAWLRARQIGEFIEAELVGESTAGILRVGERGSSRPSSTEVSGPGVLSRPSLPQSTRAELHSSRQVRWTEGLMAGPVMTDVVNGMLASLEARLPEAAPPLPTPNVTVERIKETVVGVGRFRGVESPPATGPRALRGTRLEARVRFQLWGAGPTDVDDAVVTLHGTMLDDLDQLRLEGFLKVAASDTSLAEHVAAVDGWRKTSSYDLLYEFQYEDSDGATGLIARIPIDTDLEQDSGVERESGIVSDDMVRWDDEGAAALVVAGPFTVGRIDATAFVPGPDPGGTVTLSRTTDPAGPIVHFADLPSFLAAVAGDQPAETSADVTLSPRALLDAMTAVADPIELGNWDADPNLDSYERLSLRPDPTIRLPRPTDRFEISHSTPGGLDQKAVLYIRVNAP